MFKNWSPTLASCLLIAAFVLLGASLEAIYFGQRGRAGDAYSFLFMAAQFLENPNSFFTFAPPPGHGYFPEVLTFAFLIYLFPNTAAWQIMGMANILFLAAFIWTGACLLPRVFEIFATKTSAKAMEPFASRATLITLFFTVIAFTSISDKSYFWLDGVNDHIGTYLTAALFICLIFGSLRPALKILLFLACAAGFFSSKLVIASAAAPAIALIAYRCYIAKKITPMDVRNLVMIGILCGFSFLPNLFFGHLESLQRTQIGFLHILPTLETWRLFILKLVSQASVATLALTIISIGLIANMIVFRKNQTVFLISASLLFCFIGTLLNGAFRGWNLRHFGFAIFLAACFAASCSHRFKRYALLALFAYTTSLAIGHDYSFTHKASREENVAACLKPLIEQGVLKKGLAGHWDAEPVNQLLKTRTLIKTTLRNGAPEPHPWMVDTQLNQFTREINFALQNSDNGHYRFLPDPLSALPGFRDILTCSQTATRIYLYDDYILADFLLAPQ